MKKESMVAKLSMLIPVDTVHSVSMVYSALS